MRFENDVKMYGIQTDIDGQMHDTKFENDVKMYGIQTRNRVGSRVVWFENDVKMYGIQTTVAGVHWTKRLRMM